MAGIPEFALNAFEDESVLQIQFSWFEPWDFAFVA
jgi:hypothetical protein